MDLEHEQRLTAVEDRAKSNTRRLEKVEERQDELQELTSSVKALAVREENVEADVKEIKGNVKTLIEKPGKKWDSLVEKAITAAIAILIGYIAGKLGLGG